MNWKISDLKPHKLNITIFDDLNPRHLKQLKEDISGRGLQQPLEIKSDGTIITGHQRWKAVKELGWDEIPEKLIRIRKDIEDDESKVVEELVLDNVLRRHLSELQIGAAVKILKPIYAKRAKERQKLSEGRGEKGKLKLAYLLDEKGETTELIASKFGKSRATIEKYEIAAEEANEEEKKEANRTGKLPISVIKKVQIEQQRRSLEAKKEINKKRKDNQSESLTDFIIHFDTSEKMVELDNSIQLVITSPPYWNLKEYGGGESKWPYSGDKKEAYLNIMKKVWRECFRVLQDGCRLCINIGDVYLPTTKDQFHQTIPIHADFIEQCKDIGFMYMGAIIWQKVATAMPSGGGTFMGSYPFPRDGMITPDYEYILIFKKPGKSGRIPSNNEKKSSKISQADWSKFFQGHWGFSGQKQESFCAEFPLELPSRLIKMFSFVGDIVLDPFLGSGTTLKAAKELQRKGIGYEKQIKFKPLIEEKVKIKVD